MQDICIASVVFHSPVSRIDDNLRKMEKFVSDAGKQGVNIICFPEMNITGYSTQVDAVKPIPGDSQDILNRIITMAKQHKMVILSGFSETTRNGELFASHAVVAPDGVVGVYRKLYLAPPEKGVFTQADSVPVFQAFGVTFGIQLCYDAHFPELAANMALQGADVIFIPHASPRGTSEEKFRSWMRHLPARAYDNSLFIVACNQTGSNGAGLDFPGLAVVIGPSGEVLKKDISGQEKMVVATLKADQLERVRGHRMRYFLPNRRDDLFPC